MAAEIKTALARTDLHALYGIGDEYRLPVVGVDDRGRAVVLTRRGEAVLATKARVNGEPFAEVVVIP